MLGCLVSDGINARGIAMVSVRLSISTIKGLIEAFGACWVIDGKVRC